MTGIARATITVGMATPMATDATMTIAPLYIHLIKARLSFKRWTKAKFWPLYFVGIDELKFMSFQKFKSLGMKSIQIDIFVFAAVTFQFSMSP